MAEPAITAPCPFCGSDNVEVYEFSSSHLPKGRYHWIVGCLNVQCQAGGPARPTVEEARIAWNQRGTSTPECEGA
jgi:Lar family restriction alleviation protein